MRILPIALSFAISSPALAALNILACEPEWGALSKEIGGDKVTVYTATTALQDPHRIEARPSLIARARNEARARLDAVRVLERRGGGIDRHLVAADFLA